MSLALDSLLESNDAPLPSQRTLVEDILREGQAKLSALEGTISTIESTLQNLRSKHADLTSEMNQYRCILSPIRHIPPEIIEEIFLYFAPSMHPDWDLRNPASAMFPQTLGNVCCTWRTIAFSLSELWSVVDLGSPVRPLVECREGSPAKKDESYFTELPSGNDPREYQEGYEVEAALDFVTQCLSRSGDRLLSLRLWTQPFMTLPLLEALLTQSARWSELVLIRSGGPFSPSSMPLSQFTDDFQQLRKIAFADCYIDNFELKRVPSLTELTLDNVSLPMEIHLHIPWSQLTRYCEIDCAWWSSQLASYRQLTNLVELSLKLYHEPERDGAPILLPRLRKASFDFDRWAPDFVQSLEMPALEVLRIKHAANENHSSLPVPLSSPHLKILHIQIRYMSASRGELERALERYPDLTEITIDAPDVISNTDIMRLILSRNQSFLLAPKLEIMRLSNRSFIHRACEWRTLRNMLEGRFQPTMEGLSTLQTFELATNDWAMDENVTVALKQLGSRNQWDIRTSHQPDFPAWDELHL
ncbi:hypothetical protein B0H16DRAFT_890259 [Mycena metata]|uniref:F-box domain-containing protein n=1 Tax=Mycena metata TaxID=1033252 RepID=A0AAD7K5D2_9AGAR|nr:hypothetical protein B0H16DRAFT_890259 [Mycena metata]